MNLDEIWREVKELPDAAMIQAPRTWNDCIKKNLAKLNPEEVGPIVSAVIEEENDGSVQPL